MKRILVSLALATIGCSGVVDGDLNATFYVDPMFTHVEQEAIFDAASEWHRVTNGMVDLHLVVEPEPFEHKLRITKVKGFDDDIFVDGYLWKGTAGRTSRRGGGVVTIRIIDSDVLVYGAQEITCIAMHEFGHYFELKHSSDQNDLMWINRCGDGHAEITPNDLYQFEQIYGPLP